MTKISPENFRFNLIAEENRFSYAHRIDWWVWAAKMQECPKCGEPAFSPCMNLVLLKKKVRQATKFPHVERVDWKRMAQGLRERGYIVDE